ncbi:uncharacterized protein EI97DRAFT_439852 [Westerdykella ornata]|uniref:Uncharacterized protein n=1 Tax=Westerdykella ornata TaxID=318751 RepID=A0A6A6JT30_WESOR|nr:uncharacterized protein EI97DRAFT_439852 [Westerdykella ornata]KAF2279517.1 hypothetical protein EI97DRAFT_439852 [Westerdykella ornata]
MLSAPVCRRWIPCSPERRRRLATLVTRRAVPTPPIVPTITDLRLHHPQGYEHEPFVLLLPACPTGCLSRRNLTRRTGATSWEVNTSPPSASMLSPSHTCINNAKTNTKCVSRCTHNYSSLQEPTTPAMGRGDSTRTADRAHSGEVSNHVHRFRDQRSIGTFLGEDGMAHWEAVGFPFHFEGSESDGRHAAGEPARQQSPSRSRNNVSLNKSFIFTDRAVNGL